jgi:hypothetical protein
MPEFKQSDNAAIDQAGQRAIRSVKTYVDSNYLESSTAASTYLALADQVVTVEASAPGAADVGRTYIRSTDGRTYMWNGSMWSLVAGPTPRVMVSHSAGPSVANNTNTAIAMDTESFDTDSIHSTSVNNTRLTIPSGLDGLWAVGYQYFTGQASGAFATWVGVNGGTRIAWVQTVATVVNSHLNSSSAFYPMVAGDYFELYMFQNSGASVGTGGSSTAFWAYRIGPA